MDTKFSKNGRNGRCLFSFLLLFCLSAKSISSPIFIPSGYIFRSSSDKPLSSSSLSHVGRRPVPDQGIFCVPGVAVFCWSMFSGVGYALHLHGFQANASVNFAVSQAGRFPIPVHVLKGLSGSRYTGSPFGRFSDFREPASPSFLQRFSFVSS